jgi:hypothetical protein
VARVGHDLDHVGHGLTTTRLRWDIARVPELVLAFAIVGAPLAFGGVHVLSKIILATAMVTGFVLHAHLLQRGGSRIRVGWVGLALLVALAWSVLQWVPLPAGLVALLSPSAHEARALAAATVGGIAPGWESLSLDGARSAAAVVGLTVTTFGYLLALNLWDGPSARARAAVYVEAAALATLLIGGLHAALGLDQLYGFYTASVPLGDRLLPTPFINPNHAGALFLLASFVAFGRWLDAERDAPWHLVAGIAASVGVLATFSRASALLWGAGLILLGVVAIGRRDTPHTRARYVRLVVGALSIGVVAVILLGPDRWLGEMATLADIGAPGQGGLIECWEVGARIAMNHPLLGAGNGAFEVAAPIVMPSWGVGLVAYAHNGFIQVLAELGLVIGAGVMLLAGAGFVRMVYRGRRSVAAMAASVGLVVLLVQNLVDFSLWLPGVALPAVAILASVCGSGLSRGTRFLRVRWPIAASFTVAGLLVLTSLHAWQGRPDAGYAAARAAIAAGAEPDPGELSVASAQLVLDHPADFYAYHLGAALAAADGDKPLALRLLDRAHALAPTEPNVLARRAALTITTTPAPANLASDLEALALQDRVGLERAIGIVLTSGADPTIVEGFLGRDPERIVLASRRLATQDAAERLITWGLDRYPDSLPLIEELGHRWSGRRDRVDALDRLATELLARLGTEGPQAERRGWARAAYLFQGMVLKWRSDPSGAWHMFVEAANQDPAAAETPLIFAGEAAIAMERADLLEVAIARLATLEMHNPWPRSRLHLLRSVLAEKNGDLRGAVREMQRALGNRPDVVNYEDRLATLFDEVDEPKAAAAARERAAGLRAAKQKADAKPQ